MSFLDQRPSATLLELQDIKREMIEFFNFVAAKLEEIEKKKKEQEAQTRLELEQLRKELTSSIRGEPTEDNAPQKLSDPETYRKPTRVCTSRRN